MSDQNEEHYNANQYGERLHPYLVVQSSEKERNHTQTDETLARTFVFAKYINDLVYSIQLGPKVKPKMVHHNRLWPTILGPIYMPTWFSQVVAPSATSDDLGQECPQNQD